MYAWGLELLCCVSFADRGWRGGFALCLFCFWERGWWDWIGVVIEDGNADRE